MRKHRVQMSPTEITVLEAKARSIAVSLLADHAAERMQQKKVTVREIELCLKYGQVIEIHNEANELRVVLRHAQGKPKVATCVVLGLESGAIVTVWKNAGNDNHSTLNLWAYQWNINVVNLLEPKGTA